MYETVKVEQITTLAKLPTHDKPRCSNHLFNCRVPTQHQATPLVSGRSFYKQYRSSKSESLDWFV